MGPGHGGYAKRLAIVLLLAGALGGASACASGGGGSGGGGSQSEITREQIEANRRYSNAMDLVRRLRPAWLRGTRSTFTSGGPIEAVVFLDGIRFGPLSSLRDITTASIVRMQYIGGTDATTLYGTGYMGGVIQVFTR